jgi:hypothetical protein
MSKNLNSTATSKFPDAITKRDILYGAKKATAEQKSSIGIGFADAGWLSDAVDFLTTDVASVEKIKVSAIEEGNVFLLMKIFRVLGKENNDELLQAAMKAEEQGKVRYAIKAYEKLGRDEKAQALKTSIAEDGDMKTALNSVFIPKTEEERDESESGE